MEHGGQVGNHHGFFADPEVWVSIAFVIFVLLFGRKLYAAVTAILDRRTQTIRAELDESSRLRREAETMLVDAGKQRDAAMIEARRLMDQAQHEATRLTEAARAEAETGARRRERMATDRISAAEKAAVAEVRAAAADVAARAAEQVIREGLSAETGGAIVDRAIAGLPGAFSPRRAA